MKLIVVRMGKYHWIVGDEEFGPYGPYDTKREAREDCRGLNHTMKNLDNRRSFTSDKLRPKES